MSRYTITVLGKSYQVELKQRIGSTLTFALDGAEYSVDVSTSQPQTSIQGKQAPQSTRAGSAESELRSPMPGIVSEVRISVGAEVKVGDVLLVIEAMKMENPIKAKRAGRISELKVSKGQEVVSGAVLLIIE